MSYFIYNDTDYFNENKYIIELKKSKAILGFPKDYNINHDEYGINLIWCIHYNKDSLLILSKIDSTDIDINLYFKKIKIINEETIRALTYKENYFNLKNEKQNNKTNYNRIRKLDLVTSFNNYKEFEKKLIKKMKIELNEKLKISDKSEFINSDEFKFILIPKALLNKRIEEYTYSVNIFDYL